MPTQRQPQILLVEDDEDHADLMRLVLQEAHFPCQVDHVTDGEQAIDYLRHDGPFVDSTRPDLILLDIRLPKLDGHEVLRTIRGDPALTAITVVMLTTSDTEHDHAIARASRADGYLVKPVPPDLFQSTIAGLHLAGLDADPTP